MDVLKKYARLAWNIFKIIYIIIRTIVVTYAVVFSIGMTIALFIIYYNITAPIREVKQFITANPRQTLYMESVYKKLSAEQKNIQIYQEFIPLDSISPILIKSVLAAEDDGFYLHPGFDITAIAAAMEYNRTKNQLAHGASTITQQLAKNLFVGGEKKFSRKYKELVYTLLMEFILGKDRILELYLNYAQWGKNIFGCEAASKLYFKQSSKKLTVMQASKLAAILAKPEALTPSSTSSVLMSKRLSMIGTNLYRKHLISDDVFLQLGGSDSMLRPPKPPKDSTPIKTIQQDSSSILIPIQAPPEVLPDKKD